MGKLSLEIEGRRIEISNPDKAARGDRIKGLLALEQNLDSVLERIGQ